MRGALKRRLDIALFVIFGLCAALVLLAHEDPFARKWVYSCTGLRPTIPHAKAWYKIIYDLATGALTTLIFYCLVVRLPDYQRRQRLKESLARHYTVFREDCIQIMQQVADRDRSEESPDGLTEPEKFRDYFHERVTPDRERWHDVWNNIDEYYLRELLIRMELLRDEISFILSNTDIPKDEPFEFLKRLSTAIYLVKNVTLTPTN